MAVAKKKVAAPRKRASKASLALVKSVAEAPRHQIRRTVGKVETEDLGIMPTYDAEMVRRTEQLKSMISPLGTFGASIPELLDRRRLEFGMPDDVLRQQCAFDRMLIFQIAPHFSSGNTFGSTKIIMTDKTKARKRDEAPLGIIVSAGLSALDHLRSNGMDLGHIVAFAKYTPYKYVCTMVDTEELQLLLVRSGDIIGSEDLALDMLEGRIRIERNKDGDHVFVRVGDAPGESPRNPQATQEDV